MTSPRYEHYRPSGVEWLGEIPAHWAVDRLNTLFGEVVEPGSDDLPMLSVSIHSGVSDDELAPDEMDRNVTRSDDRSKYKKVRPNDLVYNMMRAWQGGFGTVRTIGMVSPAYVVARPKGSTSTLFIERVLRTPAAVEEMRRHSRGVTDFRLRLYWDEFKNIRIALPSQDEQTAINAFLDRETAKIDALVEEQRRLVDLLKEKRQAIISHAVTKGLDSIAAIKNSGVDWLGDVPAHWQVTKLKHLASLKSGGTPSKDNLGYWSGDIPWASAKDLKSDDLADTIDHITETAIADGAAQLAPPGSVVVLVRGMMLARTFPVVRILVPMAINQDLKALNGRQGVSNEYLAWLLRGTAPETLNRLDEAGHGTKALRMEAWLSMPVPLPPLAEQERIVAFIRTELGKLDALVTEAATAVTLLQERRSALISAAVSGRIDVRALAPSKAQAA